MTETWTEGFKRLTLACAVRRDLLSRFALALSLPNFQAVGGSGMLAPQARVAAVLTKYWIEYRSAPAPVYASELIEREGKSLGPEERAALAQEWQRVLDTDIPDDISFVYDQARKWTEHRALEDAVAKAADLLAKGPEFVSEAREVIAKAEPQESARKTLWEYTGESEQRLALWRKGDEWGEKIPTGLPALDRALGVGPTRREAYYFLAPPKGAKTASLLRVALGAARRRYGVYVVTYEMAAMRMMLRLDRMTAKASREELQEDLGKLERALAGMRLMAYSASAVMVRLGFTPGFAGMIEPSTTNNPG